MADEPVEVEELDEEEEPRLDPELAARRAAAMTFIRRYGDPVLKSKATPVSTFDDALRSQVQRMGEASGLEARVIQHEMDHLDGVLILDRTSRDQRKEAIRTLREQERAEREREAA